jgi:putative FmdB family regulatory protein
VPTYVYRCTDCGHEFEAVQAIADDALTTCPQCGGALRKVFHPVGVAFKGSGFYRTDSRTSAGPDGGKVAAKVDKAAAKSEKSSSSSESSSGSGSSSSGSSSSGSSGSGGSGSGGSSSGGGKSSGSSSGGSSSSS